MQQQYRPREDNQTRYNNAAQVESTIVEVRCCCCAFRSSDDTAVDQLPRVWCVLWFRSQACTLEWQPWSPSKERSSRALTMTWTSRTWLCKLWRLAFSYSQC